MDNQDKAAIVLKLATASPMDKPARNNSENLIDREFITIVTQRLFGNEGLRANASLQIRNPSALMNSLSIKKKFGSMLIAFYEPLVCEESV